MVDNIDLTLLRAQIKVLRSEEALKHGGGDGTSDNMEARVAKLEASSEFIQREIADVKSDIRGLRSDARTDFRILFGAIITVAIGLAALMAKGFGWI